jgi:hypothetical protein
LRKGIVETLWWFELVLITSCQTSYLYYEERWYLAWNSKECSEIKTEKALQKYNFTRTLDVPILKWL